MHKYNRNFNGRYGRKSVDWGKVGDSGLFIALGIWVSFTLIDITLKAQGV